MQRFRARHQTRRPQLHGLHQKRAEMLVEPRPPHEFGMIAWLQQRLHALGAAALDKPQMAAMRTRHRLDDDARLAMLSCADDKAVVSPFHICRRLEHGTQKVADFLDKIMR